MGVMKIIDELRVVVAAKTTKPPTADTIGSLPLVVQNHAQNSPQAIALLCEDEVVTWKELNDRANRVASKLQAYGIVKGDCVSLFMQNRIEFVACMLGINKLGAIAGMINTNLISQPLIHCINLVKSKKCIFGEELLGPLNDVRESLNLNAGEDYLFVSDGGSRSAPDWAVSMDPNDVMVNAHNPAIVDKLTHGDVSFYVFTSGTTGLPKAAVGTNKRLLATGSMSSNFLLRIKASDRMYNCLPLFHGTGMVVGLAAAFHVGASTVIRRRLSVSSFWDDIRKYNCTSFVYVGEFVRYLMGAPCKDNDSENPIKSIVGNGLRPDIWTEFKERFDIERIGEFYGGSEGNGGFANVFNKDCTVGLALSPVKLVRYDVDADTLVRDANGFCIEVPDGEPGLLLIQITDTARFEGYTNAEASKLKVIENAFEEGDSYFNSGDLMRTVDVGFAFFQRHYQFVDRVGDTFRWKSENVSTNEVGDLISNFDDVEFANVYGVEIPNTDGRAGMAAIVLKNNFELNQENMQALTDHIRVSLPSFARPIFIRILKDLPTTTTHKLQKGELREHAFHLDRVKDELLVMKPGQNCYTKLSQEFYDQVLRGSVAF